MAEFQFTPWLLKSGSTRIDEHNGRKHYEAWYFHQGKSVTVVHKSRRHFKRASEAIEYGKSVVARYCTIADAIMQVEVE